MLKTMHPRSTLRSVSRVSLFTTLVMLAPLAATSARAANSCKARDFRKSLPAVDDQGDTGWCYAHSVAGLLSQALGVHVSPGSVGIEATLADPEEYQRLSDPSSAAYVAAHPGLLEDVAASHHASHYVYPRVFAYRMAGGLMLQNGLMEIGGDETFALLIAKERGVCADEIYPSGNESYRKTLDGMRDFYEADTEGDQPLPATSPIPPRVKRAALNWLKSTCPTRLPVPSSILPHGIAIADDYDDLMARYDAPGRVAAQAKLYAEINANFDRGRISAVAYDYCEHGGQVDETGECEPSSAQHPDNPLSHEEHSALIVARRPGKNGECEYFLEPHLGQSCEYLRSPWADEPTCEAKNGGFWVKPKDMQTLYSVFSIQ